MIDRKKTTQDILQEEMHRERVAVLARAGEKVASAMERLAGIGAEIDRALAACPSGRRSREALRMGINLKIHAYNLQRDQLLLCYYEFIVTREALGLIHHERLEEFYRVPPRKKNLQVRTQIRDDDEIEDR